MPSMPRKSKVKIPVWETDLQTTEGTVEVLRSWGRLSKGEIIKK